MLEYNTTLVVIIGAKFTAMPNMHRGYLVWVWLRGRSLLVRLY